MILSLHRLWFITPFFLAVLWGSIRLLDPRERVDQLHQDYPLIQAYQHSTHSQDNGWLTLKELPSFTQPRLRKLIQYMTDQFDLEVRQIRIEEQNLSALKVWQINLIVAGQTDAELWALQHYLQKELAPLVRLHKFSLHRSGSLDESVVQQGQTPNLVEGRLEFDWITQ